MYFVAFNQNLAQTKKLLSLDLTRNQYTLLRELSVNEIAKNLPSYSNTKAKSELKKRHLQRLKKLARGHLKPNNLTILFPLLRLIVRDALIHNGYESKKTGHHSSRRVGKDSWRQEEYNSRDEEG